MSQPIKKPKSAYFHFLEEQRALDKDSHKNHSVAEFAKQMGQRWKAMSTEDKKIYDDLAQKDKERYKEELSAQEQNRTAEEEGDAETKPEAVHDGFSSVFPLARVKKIIKSDDEVKTLSKEATVVLCKSLELFLERLAKRSHQAAAASKRKTIKPSDLTSSIHRDPVLDWLREDFPLLPGKDTEKGKPVRSASKAMPLAAVSSKPISSFFASSRTVPSSSPAVEEPMTVDEE